MADASRFALELDEFAASVEVAVVERKREAVVEVLSGCVLGNPVGNPRIWKRRAPKGYVGGYSRANWQVTNGAPAGGTVENRPAERALSEGRDRADEITLAETAWVVNNAPYIVPLEYAGHSRQAPNGWVRAVVERARLRHE